MAAAPVAAPMAAAPVAAPMAATPVAAAAPLAAPRPARLATASTASAPGKAPTRVKELAWKRTATSKSFLMSNGSVQLVLSGAPVHYQDANGTWKDIDTRVARGSGDSSFVNDENAFRTRFGSSTAKLVRFESEGSMIALGAAGTARKITPTAIGSRVTFPDVFGGADVRYTVSSIGLKEDIVLDRASDVSPSYAFELTTGGLTARASEDGSIGFYKKADDEQPRFLMPAPYMYDATSDGPDSTGWSNAVRQTVTQRGGTSVVTLTPDTDWLADPERKFPVVIDPTISVVPEPGDAQDAVIGSASPTTVNGGGATIPVGRSSSTNNYRGLFKFDLGMIPANAEVRSADLELFFASAMAGDANNVKISAHEVTKAWTETTANWSNLSTSYVTAHSYNLVSVDDVDALATSFEGPWKDTTLTGAVGGTGSTAGSATTADTYTWNLRVPGPGEYRVDASYVAGASRGTPTYSVVGPVKGGTGDVTATGSVDQTVTPTWNPWKQVIASKWFEPGRTATVTMKRQSGTTATNPVADAIRLVEGSWQYKEADQRDTWHSFAVGNTVQGWVDDPTSNYGFMLKATDETTAGLIGGPSYHASEDSFGGETQNRPRLVVTYDEPGVSLNPPTRITASGPELTWSAYQDPTPEAEDDLVEYQIFRGCRTLPGSACTAPASPYYGDNPSGLELVGTVANDTTSWTDESAVASTASEPATYNYWVVARTVADTQNGQNGRAASNVQTVTTPREGRMVRVFTGNISDTTLSSTQSTTNLPRPDSTANASNNRYWIQAGNAHGTYGDERALLYFDLSAIKNTLKVTDSRLELFQSSGSGSGATYDLHALTKPFVENQATWVRANSTLNWAKAGGDLDTNPLVTLPAPVSNTSKLLTFADPAGAPTRPFLTKVQGWVADSGTNHGFLLKSRDETVSQQWLSIINSESPDARFRPRLYVEHLVKEARETYEANQIPERFVPGTIVKTPVRITNTTNSTWPSGLQLSYRWTEPGSDVDITVSGERNYVPLGRALEPGESVLLELPIRTPINADTGAKRLAYDLYLDLWTGSEWFSTSNPPAAPITQRPAQGCVLGDKGLMCVDRYVEDPTSTHLGLEKFLSYTGEETGGGSQMLANLYSGNLVWSYDAMSNPSIGPRTFVRVAYNSMDVTDDGAGFGVSVQPGTLTRLGSRLSVPSSANGSAPNLMTFVDGDGTTHKYKLNEAKSTSAQAVYDRPAGVALELVWDRNATRDKMWVFTRPDGTRFYYHQDTGLPVSVVDRNGNATTFAHDTKGRLTSVTDASGRTTLTLGYDDLGLLWIRDLSGRALKFTYNASHQLTRLEDGGDFDTASRTFGAGADVKSFGLGYTEESVNSNAKLNKVTDPRGASTDITYWLATDPIPSQFALWPRRYTDRRGKATTFTYSDPDSSAAKDIVAEVTDANGAEPSTTTYRMDGYGRTISIKDANANAAESGETTKLGWDTDHNVTRLEEPNGAVSTWRYDPRTGYPVEIKDAVAVKNGTAGIELEYTRLASAPGAPTVLVAKTSAAGRKDTFTYDAEGNLETVRNGLGHGPTYTYNPNGTLATVKDARGGTTSYTAYDPNGYPLSIKDPMGAVTELTYDIRGNVIQTKDALGRLTTAEYDDLGRPTVVTTPYDGPVTRTTVTKYDANDNVVEEKAPNGAVTTYEFDAADNLLVKNLPDNNNTGRKETYSYDDLGRVTQETSPEGAATADPDDFVTRYTYDRIGQVLSVSTPFVDSEGKAQNPTTTYAYDAAGNKVLEIDPVKNQTPATDFTTKWVYDLNHQPVSITDARGFTSRNEYDKDGLLVTEIDALGNKKVTTYDAAAQPITVKRPRTAIGSTTQQYFETQTTYDPAGNVVKVTRPSGKFTETVYDLNNRPIQKKSAFTAGDANYGTPSSTFLEYNDAGELKRQSEPTFGTAGTAWTDFSYWESGDIKTSKDPWNITTSYEYDAIGQQTKRTLKSDADDATRSKGWSYYPDGSLKTFTDEAAQQPVDYADNVDSWLTDKTGTWTTVSGGTNTYGSNYVTHAAAAAGTTAAGDTFTWKVTPDVGGEFEVLVSCPVRTDSSTTATYTVNHSGGAATATVNQKACTSAQQWQSLGSFTFSGGTTKNVVLKPATSGVVVADALKLVAKDPVKTRGFTHAYDRNGQETTVTDDDPNTLTDTFTTAYDGLGRARKVQEQKGGTVLRQTEYTYDLNDNTTSSFAEQFAVNGNIAASRYTAYTWDPRDLVATVRAAARPDSPSADFDEWSFDYDARGMRSKLTKPNGNVQTSTYHEDGLVKTLIERLSPAKGSGVVASHQLKYFPDGDLQEDNARIDQGKSATATVDQVAKYAYTPTQQLASVTKSGADKGDNETYVYDAAGNVKQQTMGSGTGATTQCMTFDRNRLTKTVAYSGTACSGTALETRNHRYDVLGRSTTVNVGAQVVERYSYDGFDRMIRNQQWSSSGTHEVTKSIGYDVFDRTASQAVKVTTNASVSTRFVYLGLADQVALEEQTNTAGAYEVSKAYTYGSGGEKLALVDTPVNGTTKKEFYYGTNARGDVETLTDSTGQTTSTYRYTAYGSPDKVGTTGDDAISTDPVANADVVNPYRFSSKRFDGATGTYDMGFRDYDPGLNRFLTRDMYDGALDDVALGSDPWNTNRYAFAGGNPISRVDLDGHWGFSLSSVTDAVSGAVDSVSDTVSEVTDQVADGATAVGEFVSEHKATIAGVATGIAVYAGCTGATIGGGAVACAAVAGAAGSAVQNAMDENADHSVGGFAKSMAGGAAMGVVTLGAGKALAPVLSKVAAPLKTAAGNASAKVSATMRNAVSKLKSGCSSFSGATGVLMADGSLKAIEDIEPGDRVLATDPKTGKQVAKKVTTVWVHDDTLIDLVVDGDVITTTEDHPFWNLTDGEWQHAEEIDPGDQVLTDDGRAVTVQGLDYASTSTALAYNLTVQGIHTYHVGDQHVLVHNTSACDPTNYRGRYQIDLARQGKPRLPNDWDAHHRIPQKYRDHPEFRDFDFDAPANIRGVPGSRAGTGVRNVHQGITNRWSQFDADNSTASREVIEEFASRIDEEFIGFWWYL